MKAKCTDCPATVIRPARRCADCRRRRRRNTGRSNTNRAVRGNAAAVIARSAATPTQIGLATFPVASAAWYEAQPEKALPA